MCSVFVCPSQCPCQRPPPTIFVRVKAVLEVETLTLAVIALPFPSLLPYSLFSTSGSFSLCVSLFISSKFLSILIFCANRFTECCNLITTIHFHHQWPSLVRCHVFDCVYEVSGGFDDLSKSSDTRTYPHPTPEIIKGWLMEV